MALLLASALPQATAVDGTGLTAIYYDNPGLAGFSRTRLDPTIDFDWSTSAPGLSGIGQVQFSVVWRGQVQPAASERYTFHMTSDDGAMVWVAGQCLINNWTDHPVTENSGSIALTAGRKYDIVVRYFQNRGAAVARLQWSSPSTPKQVVPQRCLFPPVTGPKPLEVLSDLQSRTSPAWLEGTADEAANAIVVSLATAGAIAPATVTREGQGRWFASASAAGRPIGIPLSPSATTTVTVSAQPTGVGTSISRPLSWMVTDLADLPYGLAGVTLRPGDQLLLAVGGSGQLAEIDPDYDGTTFHPVISGPPGSRHPTTFSAPGVHQVRGRRDGVEVGRLAVTVVAAALNGPIADQQSWLRTKDVTLTPMPTAPSLVSFVADDPDLMATAVHAPTTGGVRLDLMPLTRGKRMLQARVGEIDGPILVQQVVDGFTLETDATRTIEVHEILPDGSQLAHATLTMRPLVRDLTIVMTTFVSGVTFGDSTTAKTISSNDFTADGGDGHFVYDLLRAPRSDANMCHTFTVQQQGVTISR